MYRKLALVILLCMLLLLSSACSLVWPFNTREDPDDTGGINQPAGSRSGTFMPTVIPTSGANQSLRTVYLMDYQQRFLVPYVLGVDNAEGIAKAVLSRLVDNPQNASALAGTEFRLPLPPGTEILGMTIRDGLAILDLCEEFLQFSDATHERLAIDAIVYTLTEFSTVDEVELRVAGRPLSKLPSGQALPTVLSRQNRDLNLEVSNAVVDINASSKVKLYFSAAGPGGGLVYFVPVTRMIPVNSDQMTAAVLELLSGPLPGSGLSADLPQGAELRSVQLNGSTLVVDFSDGLTGYGGGRTAEQAMIGSLLLTLTEIPGVDNVKITINGQVPNLPEGTDLSQPVSRPLLVNPFLI
ncbi:MAG: GerMN domain-containing protein [Bacillota bacterium]